MVNLPPDPNEQRRRDRILDFDELLAVVLALLGIGTILWWGMGRSRSFNYFSNSGSIPLVGRSSQSSTGTTAMPPGPQANSSQSMGVAQPSLIPTPDKVTSNPGQKPENPQARQLPGLGGSAAQHSSRTAAPRAMAPEALTPVTVPETMPETAKTPPPLDISDVPTDHWAYPFIKTMDEEGYLPDLPDGQFQPDKPLTRAELAALLNQAFGTAPNQRAPLTFTDVPDGFWAASAIDKAVEMGFMTGYPDNQFDPDQLVPRYQVLVSLASGLKTQVVGDPTVALQPFSDFQTMPPWAYGQVASAAQSGLVVNYPDVNQLRPNQPATRAEIVAMMYQALVEQGKLEPVDSPYIAPAN